ncbi:MAG: DUF1573 domain-containing protein, partial [Akkermansiaceae bacterium]|nr:DUF1573 domain-containing protein [Akkermansiaceae bacterium]
MKLNSRQRDSWVCPRAVPVKQTVPLAALPLAAALVLLPSWHAPAQAGSAPAAPNAASATESGADIRFERTDHDFGRIKSGEACDLEFDFTNPGSAPLKIREVRMSCGCTTLGAWTREVAPGQRGVIPVRFDSGQLSGPLHKTITVVSNASSRPIVVLNLMGTVWKDIDVLPNAACFTPHVDSAQVETKVISITSNLPEPLELAAPQCAHSSIKAELAALEPGRKFELRISVKPPFGSGTFQCPVTIKTSSSNQPELRVNTIVLVQLPITPMPGVIELKPAPLA